MRKIALMLLLPACLALAPAYAAAAYKCVIKGVTTYSQEPCGKNAKEVDTSGALAGVGVATPVPAASPQPAPQPGRAAKPAAKPPARLPGDTGGDNSCAARLQAYHDSLACFAPYRHSSNVIDVEAYKHCKEAAEPTDCE